MTGAGTTWCCLGKNSSVCRDFVPGCAVCLPSLCGHLYLSGGRVSGDEVYESEAFLLRMRWGILQGFLCDRASLEEWVYYGDVAGH